MRIGDVSCRPVTAFALRLAASAVLLCILIVALALLSGRAASDAGQVIFVNHLSESGYGIHLLDRNRGLRVNLTPCFRAYIPPRYSRIGLLIAYVSANEGYLEIGSTDENGPITRRLAWSGAGNTVPVWKPDMCPFR
jgi:Tol biopolymer transport system component